MNEILTKEAWKKMRIRMRSISHVWNPDSHDIYEFVKGVWIYRGKTKNPNKYYPNADIGYFTA